MHDLVEAINKYLTRFSENGAEIKYDSNILNLVSKTTGDIIYTVNLNMLLALNFDAEVLANMVYLNFMNRKDDNEAADD